jgi:hypothetical protein
MIWQEPQNSGLLVRCSATPTSAPDSTTKARIVITSRFSQRIVKRRQLDPVEAAGVGPCPSLEGDGELPERVSSTMENLPGFQEVPPQSGGGKRVIPAAATFRLIFPRHHLS